MRSSYSWPRMIPLRTVRLVPSRLILRCDCSLPFVVVGHAFQMSRGIRLWGKWSAGRANFVLSILSFSHAIQLSLFSCHLVINMKWNTLCFASTILDCFKCFFEIRLCFKWWQAKHGLIHFRCHHISKRSQVSQKMDNTKTVKPSQVVITLSRRWCSIEQKPSISWHNSTQYLPSPGKERSMTAWFHIQVTYQGLDLYVRLLSLLRSHIHGYDGTWPAYLYPAVQLKIYTKKECGELQLTVMLWKHVLTQQLEKCIGVNNHVIGVITHIALIDGPSFQSQTPATHGGAWMMCWLRIAQPAVAALTS